MTRRPLDAIRARAAVATAVALLLASPPARAQTPVPAPAVAAPTPGPVATAAARPASLAETLTGGAKADYDAARLLFGDRDFAGALVKFQSAYDQSRDPRLLFNMGACEKNLRHYARTIGDFERYRTEAAASLSAAEREEVDRYISELQPFVGAVRVSANEPDAEVFVDDAKVGATPLASPVRVDLGQRRVRVKKDGFTELDTTITVTGSAQIPVEARLERIVHAGRVVVHADPKDAIAIDDQVVGTGEYEGMIASGGHQLRVTAPGMQTYQSELVVMDHQTRTLDVKLSPAPGVVPVWAWVVGSAVVAGGLVVGGVFLFKPTDRTSEVVGTLNPPGVVSLSSLRHR